MTVITYRSGILACDSCWSDGDGLISNIQNKIMRLPSGAIYGGSGAPDDRALLGLLCDVKERTRLPDWATLQGDNYKEVEALVALPDGSVWRIEGGPKGYGCFNVTLPYMAVGAGAAVAIGALAAGASAKRATEIACRHNALCREPIYTLELAPKRRRERLTKSSNHHHP